MNFLRSKESLFFALIAVTGAIGVVGTQYDFDDKQWTLAIEIFSLIVTIYFTWQLVENDNKREERHLKEQERALKLQQFKDFKARILKAVNKNVWAIKNTVKNIAMDYPKDRWMIIAVYQEILVDYETSPDSVPTMEKFMEYCKDAGVEF